MKEFVEIICRFKNPFFVLFNIFVCYKNFTKTVMEKMLFTIIFFFLENFIPDGEEANSKEFLTYYLTPEGGNMLRRVLCVIKHLNPDITYCPLLEPITSILLHYFDEEQTFSIVSGLLSKSFAAPFMDQTKIENVTTDATLQDLFRSVSVCIYFS